MSPADCRSDGALNRRRRILTQMTLAQDYQGAISEQRQALAVARSDGDGIGDAARH